MTIVVTGGTRGIGLAIAEGLAAAGEPIVLGYHSNQRAAGDAVARLAALGASATAVAADVGGVDQEHVRHRGPSLESAFVLGRTAYAEIDRQLTPSLSEGREKAAR